MDKCPDCLRQPIYADMALDAGNFCLDQKDARAAERYFRLSIAGAPQIPTAPQTLGEALYRLAGLELDCGRWEEAHDLATRAAHAAPHMIDARTLRSRAALSLRQQTAAKADSARAARLLDEAKADLEMVPANHPFFPEAQRLLESIQKGQPR